MFIDRARIRVIAGDGGNGCAAFRREKSVPRGGPSGGGGGKGGGGHPEGAGRGNTLLYFQYKRVFKADRGRHGEGAKRHGKDGGDVTLLVPPGTQAFKEPEHELLHDFSKPGERLRIAVGGRGGRGNAQFATPTNRAPRDAEAGRTGQEVELSLSLKLIADVGLVGFPNVGKSTLISRISAARPKIADYPFTTLTPYLGVVALEDYRSFVVADIPGLIEGAHLGHGLGIQFLRHIERTRLLAHLVDVSEFSGRDPVRDFEIVMEELGQFSEDLLKKPMILVATKVDVAQDPERLESLRRLATEKGLAFYEISSVTGLGLEPLKTAM